MDLEELYHKYRIRLKQSLFATFASVGLVVCTVALSMLLLFHNVSIRSKFKKYILTNKIKIFNLKLNHMNIVR